MSTFPKRKNATRPCGRSRVTADRSDNNVYKPPSPTGFRGPRRPTVVVFDGSFKPELTSPGFQCSGAYHPIASDWGTLTDSNSGHFRPDRNAKLTAFTVVRIGNDRQGLSGIAGQPDPVGSIRSPGSDATTIISSAGRARRSARKRHHILQREDGPLHQPGRWGGCRTLGQVWLVIGKHGAGAGR